MFTRARINTIGGVINPTIGNKKNHNINNNNNNNINNNNSNIDDNIDDKINDTINNINNKIKQNNNNNNNNESNINENDFGSPLHKSKHGSFYFNGQEYTEHPYQNREGFYDEWTWGDGHGAMGYYY